MPSHYGQAVIPWQMLRRQQFHGTARAGREQLLSLPNAAHTNPMLQQILQDAFVPQRPSVFVGLSAANADISVQLLCIAL